jgi:DNA-binding transcriptional LysR family regulator
MNLRNLTRVATLARTLSYKAAAEQLGISQSVLTRSIQEVEQAAKVRLFDRDRAGVHLTPVGAAYVERGLALLKEANELDRMLERAGSGEEGKVAIGMAPLTASALIPAPMTALLTNSPELQVYVAVRRTEALLPMLLNEEVELVVCPEGALQESVPLRSTLLGHIPLSLLVRRGHPLLCGDDMGGRKYPVISANSFDMSNSVPAALRDRLEGAPRMIVENYDCLARITEESDAVWFASSLSAIERLAEGRLLELPLPDGQAAPPVRLRAYGLERRSTSPAAGRLLESFRTRISAVR